MAKGKSNLIVEIGGKVGASFKKSIRSTQQSVSSLSKNISRSLNDTAAGAAKGFKNVVRSDAFQGAAVAAGGLALAMRKAVRTAADFESGMLKVKAVTGATGADFKALQAKAKEMGASTKFTASEAAAGMEFLARAGYTTNQILESTGPLLAAASAEGMELGTVSDIVSNIVGSNKMLVSDTAQIADTLAQTSRKANVNIASLGESFKAIGPTGANAGLSLQQLSATFGVLGDSGIKGAEAGTALRNVLVRLSAPPSEAAKALTRLGVATKDANGNMKPMETILGDLSGKMKELNLGSAEQADVLSKVFGLRALAAGQVLMEANANGKLAEKIAQVNDHQGAAGEMSATVMKGFEGQMTLMQSAFDGLLVSLGTPLIGPLVTIMQTLASIAKPIGDLLTDMPVLATAVGVVSAGFITFVAILPIIGALSGGMMALTGATTAGAAAMLLLTSPVTLTIAAIVGLIAIFQLLYNKVDWFKAGVDGTLSFLGSAWQNFSSLIQSVFTTAIGYITPIFEAWKTSFMGVVQVVQGIWQVFTGIFTGDSETAVEGVKNIFGGLKAWFSGFVDSLKAIFAPAAQPLLDAFNSVVTFLQPVIDGISAIFDGMVLYVQGIWKAFTSLLTGDFEGAADGVSMALEGLKGIFGTILGGLKVLWDGLVTHVKGIGTQIVDTFLALPEKLKGVGQAIINTIRDGFISRFTALKDTVVNSFKEIRKLLPFSDAKKGPFKDLTKSGRSIVTTLADGVRDRQSTLQKAMTQAADITTTAFDRTMSPIIGGPQLAFAGAPASPTAGSMFSGNQGQNSGRSPAAPLLNNDALGAAGASKAPRAAATLAPVVNVSVANANASPEEIATVVTTALQEMLSDAESDQRAGLND